MRRASAPDSASAESGPSWVPLIGGMLLARQWAPQQLFWAAAVPALVSTIVMVAMRALLKNDRGSSDLQPVAPPLTH